MARDGPYILLVEDDERDAEMTRRVLSREGVPIPLRHVRDGAEALAVLFPDDVSPAPPATLPAFVLLDLKLPKVDGLEVLRRVKSHPLTRSIPVVAFTSSRESPDIEACYALGVNSYVVKPLDFDDFSEAVRQTGSYWLLRNEPPEHESEK